MPIAVEAWHPVPGCVRAARRLADRVWEFTGLHKNPYTPGSPVLVEIDNSIGGSHELIPPSPFPWKGKGAQEKKSHASLHARADGVVKKCLSDWNPPS